MLQSENKDHISPVEAGAGTELGNKDIKFCHEVASKFIRIGLIYILNLGPFIRGWKSTSQFRLGYVHFAETI